jgi:hypothetical protein
VPRKRNLRLRTYPILCRAVEEGVAYGMMRAFKYADNPTREHMQEQIEQAVMNALCEVVELGDEE